MDLIGIPLQGRIVKQANRQIKKTKQLLDAEQAKGILFISSDGNSSLQPYDVMFFLDRILKKKKMMARLSIQILRVSFISLGVCLDITQTSHCLFNFGWDSRVILTTLNLENS